MIAVVSMKEILAAKVLRAPATGQRYVSIPNVGPDRVRVVVKLDHEEDKSGKA